jgi:hypothetical protein
MSTEVTESRDLATLPSSGAPKLRVVKYVLAAAIMLAWFGSTAYAASPASAVDSNCSLATTFGSVPVYRYIVREGWGLTSWGVSPNIWAYDRCNHWGLSVSVGTYYANITAKGVVTSTTVQYRRDGSTSWYSVPYLSSASSSSHGYGLSHVDLTSSQRIRYVRVVTTVYAKGGGSGWVGVGSSTIICDMVNRTCG